MVCLFHTTGIIVLFTSLIITSAFLFFTQQHLMILDIPPSTSGAGDLSTVSHYGGKTTFRQRMRSDRVFPCRSTLLEQFTPPSRIFLTTTFKELMPGTS